MNIFLGQEEIWSPETLLPHRSLLLPLPQVHQWPHGRRGKEIEEWRKMVDVDPSITSEAGRHSRHQKYRSASVLLGSDEWRWAESVHGDLSWPGRNPSCLCLMWKIEGWSGGKEHLDYWSSENDLCCCDSLCSQFSVSMLYLQIKVRFGYYLRLIYFNFCIAVRFLFNKT